ncbi:RES family NAD+ phosphorylase [Vibrio chagasii]|uniref:RES family NAD+ phosphorylase n=1 Tax=Vibrio chagasii TaxID=170679 RepID=UPI001EFD25EB|nr:RES family NAD+ phosphorylase [Vibrio chagasii]MCG9569041.1 RES family NAD+ phosphorylase [Vibrio chagasii]MCG9607994.1 RES family NAD+ phosphorylase [Vibrio chagasii]
MDTTKNGEAHQLNALTERVHALSTNDLTICEMNNVYRVQPIMYKGKKTKALLLHPGTGRWNGREIEIAMSYVATTDTIATLEALYHADSTQDFEQERFYSDKTLIPREMVNITFCKPLRLINVTALTIELRISRSKLLGKDYYTVTQLLAEALYTKFGGQFDGIIYTSQWGNDDYNCAAIWSYPDIVASSQTPLLEYESEGQDIYEILDDLQFDKAED